MNRVARLLSWSGAFLFVWVLSAMIDRPFPPPSSKQEPKHESIPEECVKDSVSTDTDSGTLVGPTSVTHNGFIVRAVCGPGVVTVIASGTTYQRSGPLVVVTRGRETFWEGQVIDRTEIEVEFLAAGWLGVGFLNDASDELEDRNLWVESITFVRR